MMRRFFLVALLASLAVATAGATVAPAGIALGDALTAAHSQVTHSQATHIPGVPPVANSLDSGMPPWLEEYIERYGSIALFGAFVISGVGLHLSEDLILIPAGWIAAHDLDQFVQFWIWAYLGIVVGDGLWFWMCGTFGTRFLHSKWFKRVLHPRRLLEVKHQIDRRGALVLFAARFIPGTRTPVITMCGLMHMAWWKFLAVELSCAAVTVPLQMLVGVAGARAARSAGVTDVTHQVLIAVALTVAFVLLMYFAHLWIRARRAKRRMPRAPARWLRLYQATKELVTRHERRSTAR